MSKQALWSGLLEDFSQIVSVFIAASHNFISYFLNNKAAKKLKKHRRLYRKYRYWFDFKDLPKNNSSPDTIPWVVIFLESRKSFKELWLTCDVYGIDHKQSQI
jgi:hypothetical protein